MAHAPPTGPPNPRRRRRMSIDPDSGFARPPIDLQPAGSDTGHDTMALPGNVPAPASPNDDESQVAADLSPGGVDHSGLDEYYRQPLPASVDQTIPDIGKAWAWFLECDHDRSGVIEFNELRTLCKTLGLSTGRSGMLKAYREMCQSIPFGNREGVTFEDFASWWGRYEVMRRRDVGRVVQELFRSSDMDGSGILDKAEFARLLTRANREKSIRRHAIPLPKRYQRTKGQSDKTVYSPETQAVSADRDFELDEAWAEIRKVPLDVEGTKLGVNFAGFEHWWKTKTGMIVPDIPVLPEFMVLRIEDKVKAEAARAAALSKDDGTPQARMGSSKKWNVLREKLFALVRMKRSWGTLHDIYHARQESLFEENPLPPFIRDPDSRFSAGWDLTSLVMLVYVCFTVPLRMSFDVDIELWTWTFWLELVVDAFFISDVMMNFRTSFYDANGFRENRPRRIASKYIHGWFLIDFVSCLPYGYIQYFVPQSTADSKSELKAVKVARLMKITKMMRLTRLKQIIRRQGGDGSLQLWQSVIFTMCMIVLITHFLACFWYLVGSESEQLGTGAVAKGWVEQQENWDVTLADANWTDISDRVIVVDPTISVSVRYWASMCFVLNALENAHTTLEYSFSVLAELMRDVILGLVASLITTITISLSQTDTDTEIRLQRLRQWMAEKKLPKAFRKMALEHFTESWTTNYIQLDSLLGECPPAMASKMAVLLYGRCVAAVPIFKGLSHEVLSALCLRCKPMMCVKNQNIIQAGEPGKEMYMVLRGEVEVSERLGTDLVRLGFLAEGAFFGEAPVLGKRGEAGLELRKRTVRAVTDVELVYISRDDVSTLCDNYAELHGRLTRFDKSGEVLTNRTLRKMDMSVDELKQMAHEFKKAVRLSAVVREEQNLCKDSFVPSKMLPRGAVTVLQAAARFKKVGAARRMREQEEREEKAAQFETELAKHGGIEALLLQTKSNQEHIMAFRHQMVAYGDQMVAMRELMKAQHEELSTQIQRLGR